MNKLEIQKRVLKDGDPLSLNLFNWDEDYKIFSTRECNLLIDLEDVDDCTIMAGFSCKIKAGEYCVINADKNCTIEASNHANIHAYENCVINARWDSIIKVGNDSTINTSKNCIISAGKNCTINADDDSMIKAYYDSTINVNARCVIARGDLYEIIKSIGSATYTVPDPRYPKSDRGYDIDFYRCKEECNRSRSKEENRTIKIKGYHIPGIAYLDEEKRPVTANDF